MAGSWRWPIVAVAGVCSMWLWVACGGGDPAVPVATPGAVVIDDDDYFEPPDLGDDVETAPPVSSTVGEDDDASEDDDDSTFIEPFSPGPGDDDVETPIDGPNLNVEVVLSLGTTTTVGSANLRVAFYTLAQLDASNRPVDAEVYQSEFFLFSPFQFPITFQTNLLEGDSYVAEAWQDTNGSGLQDAGDVGGASALFAVSFVTVSVPITISDWPSVSAP